MVEPPEVVYRDEVMQLATWRDLFVERWTGPGKPVHLEALTREHGRFVQARAPEQTIFVVHLVSSEIALPDAAMRHWIAEHVKAIEGHVAACVMVLTAKGFQAALFHSILSMATALRRSKYPYRISRDLEDALPWLARHRPARSPHGTEHELAAAYDALEKKLGALATR